MQSQDNDGVANVPVAEPVLLTEYDEGNEQENLLGQKFGLKDDGFQVLSSDPYQQQQSGGYWGRFDDAEATILPSSINDDNDDGPVATARLDDRQIRIQFIRKVYLILSAQLFFTFSSCAVMTLHESTRKFVLGSGFPLYWFNVVAMFVLVCALSAYKRSYPINMILLSAFTLSSSYLVGTVTALYAQAGAGDLVLEALFITAFVFVALTVFTLQSKWDFSFMGAFLGMALLVMILWGFFGIIFGLQTGWVYALLGSLLFSGFIIYDTYMLAERHDPQDYVIAAIELYLDLINLFLYILQLLGSSRR